MSYQGGHYVFLAIEEELKECLHTLMHWVAKKDEIIQRVTLQMMTLNSIGQLVLKLMKEKCIKNS